MKGEHSWLNSLKKTFLYFNEYKVGLLSCQFFKSLFVCYSDSYLGLDQQYDLYLEVEGEIFYSDPEDEDEEMPECLATADWSQQVEMASSWADPLTNQPIRICDSWRSCDKIFYLATKH